MAPRQPAAPAPGKAAPIKDARRTVRHRRSGRARSSCGSCATSDSYAALPGHTYRFRVRARDALGNTGSYTEGDTIAVGAGTFFLSK